MRLSFQNQVTHPSPIPNSNSNRDIHFSAKVADKNKAGRKRKWKELWYYVFLKQLLETVSKVKKRIFVLSKYKFLGGNMTPWAMYEVMPLIPSLSSLF